MKPLFSRNFDTNKNDQLSYMGKAMKKATCVQPTQKQGNVFARQRYFFLKFLLNNIVKNWVFKKSIISL